MKTLARIVDGVIAEPLLIVADSMTPEALFHGDLAVAWIDITGVVPPPAEGWTTADGGKTFAAPILEAPVIDLVAYANMKQWELATGGFTAKVAGQALTFSTSEVSLALINGKFLRLAQPSPPATFNWQFPTGFVSIAAADFIKVATAISDFVQATFDALPAVFSAIAAGTITTTAQVDAAAWPSAVASS